MRVSREHLLYLGELIERDGVEYKSNNLIKSNAGSGKTYYILNQLNKEYKGKKLMLVSTTSLKDKFSEEEMAYVTQDILRREFNVTDDNIYIMTYAEFGYKIEWSREFMYDFSVIYCDEIHSLFDYYFIERNRGLAAAISALFDRHDNITIFYFTATTHYLDNFIDKYYKDLYKNVEIFDYYNHPEIRRYFVYNKIEFVGNHGLDDAIDNLEDMHSAGKKGLIYNEKIDGMKRIKGSLKKKGYKAEAIWSRNSNKPMTDEQLYVMDYILKNERIPNEYDFIIINGAMREGWNLKDDRLNVVILNTLNETDIEQVLGRVRGDVPVLYSRVKDSSVPLDVKIINREKTVKVIEDNLGEELDTTMKNEIVEELNIRREEDGRLVKWPTISKALKSNGYKIEDKTVRRDGKRVRVQIITRVEQEVKPSSASKSSRFMAKLGATKFAEVNKEFLSKYINKDERIAYSHIKSAYERFVGSEGWSDRKFTDVTYLLARDEELFSKSNYVNQGLHYINEEEIDIIRERAKYEKSAVELLEKAELKAIEAEQKEEEELLKHIAAHGGQV